MLTILGYSQGGLIARGMLEMCGDRHNVKTFISLSSPQGGQFGGTYFGFTYYTVGYYFFFSCNTSKY